MDRTCLNCFYINFLTDPMICEFHSTDDITLDWSCHDWYPNQTVEIQMLREENEKLKKEKWVSVKDKLPIDRVIVYCTDGYITTGRIVNQCIWDDMFSWHDETMWQFEVYEKQPLDYVSHWMELPKPPK